MIAKAHILEFENLCTPSTFFYDKHTNKQINRQTNKYIICFNALVSLYYINKYGTNSTKASQFRCNLIESYWLFNSSNWRNCSCTFFIFLFSVLFYPRKTVTLPREKGGVGSTGLTETSNQLNCQSTNWPTMPAAYTTFNTLLPHVRREQNRTCYVFSYCRIPRLRDVL